MKKIILTITILLLTCACDLEYNIEIKESEIDENLSIIMNGEGYDNVYFSNLLINLNEEYEYLYDISVDENLKKVEFNRNFYSYKDFSNHEKIMDYVEKVDIITNTIGYYFVAELGSGFKELVISNDEEGSDLENITINISLPYDYVVSESNADSCVMNKCTWNKEWQKKDKIEIRFYKSLNIQNNQSSNINNNNNSGNDTKNDEIRDNGKSVLVVLTVLVGGLALIVYFVHMKKKKNNNL